MQSDSDLRPGWPVRDRVFVAVIVAAMLFGAWLVNRPVPSEEAESATVTGIDEQTTDEPPARDEPLPDFSAYRDARTKKQAFFDYLAPLVEAHNRRLLAEREQVQALADLLAAGESLNDEQTARVMEFASRYRIDYQPGEESRAVELLLRRVDIIPVSLALIQSASESGWGTSRFAREANNLFGEKCFQKGCGIAPAHRQGGIQFARFDRPNDAVQSYMHNLNTNPAYLDFRKLRERLRERDKPITGPALADGLHRYSERGEQYVQELQGMISRNKLQRLDQDVLSDD